MLPVQFLQSQKLTQKRRGPWYVYSLSHLCAWNSDLFNTGMATGYLLLDDWLSRLCIQVLRSNQHCMFISSPEKYPILTTHQSNAYVSGMETDLELYGNELNYFTTFFK
jgi:hypothetical protein